MTNHPNRSKRNQEQHNVTQQAKPQHTPLLPLSERGAWCQSYPREADKPIEELLAALKLVAKGIRSGHIEDQTIIDRSNPHAASLPMTPLSEIIDAAIAKAEGR